jgi:hypothetical protein
MQVLTALMINNQRLPKPAPPATSSPLLTDKAHVATRCALDQLLDQCWVEEPDKRPSFAEIVLTLESLARRFA